MTMPSTWHELSSTAMPGQLRPYRNVEPSQKFKPFSDVLVPHADWRLTIHIRLGIGLITRHDFLIEN